jgi:fructokinase|tara:strand:+ start:811 stop:1737 length:927 start_codon:yes stop_codon:yes gene_type:complete
MIICAGESLIDMVSFRGEAEYTPHVGGSNFNSSIALGRLGADTYYFGAVSNDSYGELIESKLRHSKVKEDFVIKTNRPTTLAYADVIDGIAEYTFVDEHSAGRLLDSSSLKPFLDGVKKAKALLVGGISLQAEPCGSSWQSFIEEVAGHLPIYFDANVRPDFIENKQAYLARFIELTHKVDILKISDEDYRYLFGAQDINEVSKSWLDNGIKLVILTLGSEGSKVINGNGNKVFAESLKVDVVDTIAAGDTFNAGFLLNLDEQDLLDRDSLKTINNDQLTQALSFANKVASITVTRKGANPPWHEELS